MLQRTIEIGVVLIELSGSAANNSPPIVKGISLHIQAGSRIAIVGRSGRYVTCNQVYKHD